MTDDEQTQREALLAVSMQELLLFEGLLQAIIVEAEAKGDPRLDNPDLREGRPGAREQLKNVQDEIERRKNNPIDQIVALQPLSFKAQAPKI